MINPFLPSLPISKNYNSSLTRSSYTVMSTSERTPLADYMDLIKLLRPSQSIGLTLHVHTECCTLTLKYINCQVVFATLLEDGWDIYWYPTNLCYLSQVLHTHSKVQQLSSVLATPPVCAMSHCFTFSVSVMCHCSSRSSPDCFIINLIKQTAWTCQ